MSRHYSLAGFLRQIPPSMLRNYIERRRLLLGVAWGSLEQGKVEPVMRALESLDEGTRREVEREFSAINEMACTKGTNAILEEGRLWGRDWSEQFGAMANNYERALWAFINEPKRFAVAEAFCEMDRLSFGWHRFVGRRLEASSDSEALETLGAQLADLYRRLGKGRHCHVDTYRRVDPERSCYFAYPEDAPTTDLGYDASGRFERRPRQSAFEIIFVYRPEEGLLEMYARGDARQKEALAEAFCNTILGLTSLPDDTGLEPFRLEELKRPDFEFMLEPGDGIESVDLRMLRLDLPSEPDTGLTRRVTVQAKSTPQAPHAIRRLIDESLQQHRVLAADVQIGAARICITFREPSRPRPKTLTFEVSYPDRCTLKDDPYDQIARKCLARWGIARASEMAVAAAEG